jgi:hypothetical protein
MSTKTFCDICDKEIIGHDSEIKIWSHPMKTYCKICWTDKKNWPRIHKVRGKAKIHKTISEKSD